MAKLNFVKMVAAGNDFVIVDASGRAWSKVAKTLCQRRTGVGADGLLVLEKSRKADFRMRIFNADGSEAEMCGNGLRCAALCASKRKNKIRIETKAGIYEASITGKDKVKIKMEEPKELKLDVSIEVNGRPMKVDYIDIGVPHAVILVEGLDGIDVDSIGRGVRYHERFKPKGTNVDFAEVIDDKNIRIRTYERGVEGETLACGTGAVAAAIISNEAGHTGDKVNVHVKGGVLGVSFRNNKGRVKDVYLEGEAREVYNGEVDYV